MTASRADKTTLYATLRSRGQLTIPSELREEMGWEEGDRIRFIRSGDRVSIERRERQLSKFYGVLSDFARPENAEMDSRELMDEEETAMVNAIVADVVAELER